MYRNSVRVDSFIDNTDMLQLIYINADSLNNKLSELQILSRMEGYDVMAIVEANSLIMTDEQDFHLAGYHIISNLSDETCRRGIVFYYRNHLIVDKLDLNFGFSEALFVKVINTQTLQHIFLLIVYRSPSSDSDNNDKLLNVLLSLAGVYGPKLIIMEDFNFKYISWESLSSNVPTEQKFVDCILDNYLTQHCQEFTRYRDGQQSSLLDLVLTQDDTIIGEVDYLAPLGISDHVTLTFRVNLLVEHIPTNTKKFHLNAGDYDGMRQDLSFIDWNDLFNNCPGIDGMWNCFADKLRQLTRKFVPLRTMRESKYPKWASINVRNKIKKKKKKFLTSKYAPSLKNLEEYRKARNSSNKKVNLAVYEHELSIAKDIKEKPKVFWRYANLKLKRNHQIDFLVENGDMITTPAAKVDCLNRFFSSVFNTDSSIPEQELVEQDLTLGNIILSKKFILDKLTSIKTDKSPGPDTILPWVLYECRFELVNPLYVLFRACCEQSKIPSEWKKANVIPIYKKGKKSDPSNYRSISLTSTVCKLYESIIKDQILHFFTVNDKISSSQFGFLSGKSCALQLLYVVNEWIKILDVSSGGGIFYSVFRKAFDSVSHNKLLFKLENKWYYWSTAGLVKGLFK